MDATDNLLTLPLQLYIKDTKDQTKIKDTTFIQILKSNSLIGLYFSGHWCPPCNHFTPQLLNFYNAVNKEKKQIEIEEKQNEIVSAKNNVVAIQNREEEKSKSF